jgi:hypothetical protein
MIPCKACGVKAGQYPHWLCRRCDRAAGTYTPARGAAPVCRRCQQRPRWRDRLCEPCWRAVMAGPGGESAPVPDAGPVRERRIAGRVYVVVWDGSRG